ncbi:PREDICTED: matrix metalloproteinase-24-like [Dufourea novaeangliae]|uniref:matrix metalloproteinase-24-like n=1 Tax=Dufourea novaeangliae TaxID=178035 RepID=UPI000767BD39|nr:PREDICTED: matrix metalloproteinase-24-like [Dufourea novaeangliae]
MAVLYCIVFLCVAFIPGKYESAPILSNVDATSASLFAMDFMKKYGYLEHGTADSDALYKESAITDAIKNVQKFGNIPVTGKLDNATLELMASPRCGVTDVLRKTEDQQRKKRYIISSEGWRKQDITY